MMNRYIAVIAALSLFQLQAAHDWAGLQAVAKGSALQVQREDKQKFRGTLASISENQLVLSVDGGSQSFGRSTIREVKLKSKGRSTRNALIAAGIAGGVTAAGMSFICASCWGELDDYGQTVAIYTAAVAGSFGLIAWLLPSYKTVYKAPKSPRSATRK